MVSFNQMNSHLNLVRSCVLLVENELESSWRKIREDVCKHAGIGNASYVEKSDVWNGKMRCEAV